MTNDMPETPQALFMLLLKIFGGIVLALVAIIIIPTAIYLLMP